MKLRYRDLEIMAASSEGFSPTSKSPSEVEGSIKVHVSIPNVDGEQGSDHGQLNQLSPEDMSWIVEHGSQCNDTANTQSPSAEQHQRFTQILSRAIIMATRGEGMNLVENLCRILKSRYFQRARDEEKALSGGSRPHTSRPYEYMLTVLCSPKELPLSLVAELLRQLADCSLYMSTISFSKDRFCKMCSQILQYLHDIVPEKFPVPPSDILEKGVVSENQQAVSVVVNRLHGLACWGLSNYGSSSESLAVVRDSLGKLQVNVWERLINMGYRALACTAIGAAIQAMPTKFPRDFPHVYCRKKAMLFSMDQLEEKNIIRRLLLCESYRMHHVSPASVKKFLTVLGQKGVVVKEDDFVFRMRICAGLRPPVPPTTMESCNVADLINATMLEVLDISAYTDEFLEHALEWLDTQQADNSLLSGSRIFGILRKLLKTDKHKRWGKRFCALFRKHGASVPDSLLLNCLKEAADHYSPSHHVSGPPENNVRTRVGLVWNVKQAKLLQACSSADTATSMDMATSGTRNHKEEFIQKAETWKVKEIDLEAQMSASSSLTQALSTTFPQTRHETAKKCLKRLALAQHLTVGLNPNKANTTFAESVIAHAMSPELQALEAVENESLLHCKAVRQVEELREKHVREYDALKQEQYEKLVKFAKLCRQEKDDVVWDAVTQKAKVMARVESACAGKDADILKRLFRNAEGAYQQMEVELLQTEGRLSQMEDKHKESLERIPNADCAVCYLEFSLKRKRACLDPCGHASTCVDCATQEWKRTKTCSLCKTSIEKPIAVPFKLFF